MDQSTALDKLVLCLFYGWTEGGFVVFPDTHQLKVTWKTGCLNLEGVEQTLQVLYRLEDNQEE